MHDQDQVTSQFQIYPQTGRISLASLESADVDVAGFVAQIHPRADQPCTCVLDLKKNLHGIPHLQSPSHFLSTKRKSNRKKTHFVCLLCSDVHLAYWLRQTLSH